MSKRLQRISSLCETSSIFLNYYFQIHRMTVPPLEFYYDIIYYMYVLNSENINLDVIKLTRSIFSSTRFPYRFGTIILQNSFISLFNREGPKNSVGKMAGRVPNTGKTGLVGPWFWVTDTKVRDQWKFH